MTQKIAPTTPNLPAVWETSFHLHAPVGWLSDPNGLCYFQGNYHAFFQYTPDWPESELRSWGHAQSTDLLTWSYVDSLYPEAPGLGLALEPSIPEDASGVYSGCAFIENKGGASTAAKERMWLYYTGNVKHRSTGEPHDYIHTGREANQILVTSDDGQNFSPKQTLLTNADYPDSLSLHVRDPKVWQEGDTRYMLLGARDLGDKGCALVYSSADGVSWSYYGTLASNTTLGFMWECPNLVRFYDEDGQRHDFLAMCPQGLEAEPYRWQNRWQAGYVPLKQNLEELAQTPSPNILGKFFVEWDHGFDFYAPQIFDAPAPSLSTSTPSKQICDTSTPRLDTNLSDDKATRRSILLGWMGGFNKAWTSADEALGWCHCMTLARELSLADDGSVLQNPAAELIQLRTGVQELLPNEPLTLKSMQTDICFEDIAGKVTLSLNEALTFELQEKEARVFFTDENTGKGRTARSFLLKEPLRNLRCVIDGSAVELFLNGGSDCFSTRWFPQETQLSICANFESAQACVYELKPQVH